MELTGKIENVSMNFETGKVYLSLEINERDRLKNGYDKLKAYDKLSVKLDKFRKKRSLDANNYMWHLCSEIAKVLTDTTKDKYTKDDIYISAIKEIGVFKQMEVNKEAVSTAMYSWQLHGTGWVSETVDNGSHEGFVILRLYYGSSTYNTKQMTRLINNIVADCKELGIETMTRKELERLTSLWKPDAKYNSRG